MPIKKKTKAKAKTKAASRAGSPRKAVSRPRPKSKAGTAGPTAARLRDLADWRQQTLARMRALIMEADSEIVEERKWRKPSNPAGVPTWLRDGIVCTGETYKKGVKLTFAHGASLPDPSRLFNSGLEGNLRRAIDISEGENVDPTAFKALVMAAVARNVAAKKN
jgi:hypothetical protein